MPEGGLDPVADGAGIDADGCQCAGVEAGEQGGGRAQSFQADDFLLHALGRDPVLAQDRGDRHVGSGKGEQEVLAAHVPAASRRACARAWNMMVRASSVKVG